MKYFNFKFMKENFKQAKGMLIFFASLLPLITVISLIVLIMGDNTFQSFSEFGLVTYILAFIIPTILAFVLYGFVFKKKSVDFYLSKPINRKTIFLTNYLGGILLILGILLLNTLIMYIFSLTTNLIIPFSMLLDYFIYFSITYLFIFSVTTLAICLSGNLITGLIVSILIISIVPFFKIVNQNFMENNQKAYVYCDTEECQKDVDENGYQYVYMSVPLENYNLNTPFAFLTIGKYRSTDLILTGTLTIVYSILGFIAFLKRKMENNECSFKSELIYNLVKCLTLLPLAFICFRSMFESFSNWLIFIVISLIYFFAYDLIVKKRIDKIVLNLAIFVLSIALLQGMFLTWNWLSKKEIYLDNINTLTIDYNGYTDLQITDKNLIKNIIIRPNYYNYNTYRAKTKYHNTIYTFYVYLPIEDNLVDNYIKENNILSDLGKLNFDKLTATKLTMNYVKVNASEELINLLKLNKDNEVNEDINFSALQLYYYENHEFKSLTYEVGKSKDLANYVAHQINNTFINNYKYDEEKTTLWSSYYSNIETFNSKINQYVLRFLFNKNNDAFLNYFKEHQNDEIKEGYYILTMGNSLNKQYNYIVGDGKSFDDFYMEKFNEYQNDEKLNELLDDLKERDLYEYKY